MTMNLNFVKCVILLSNEPWQSWLHKAFKFIPKIIEVTMKHPEVIKDPLEYPLVSIEKHAVYCPHVSKPQMPQQWKFNLDMDKYCGYDIQGTTLNIVAPDTTFEIYHWLVVLADVLGVKINAFVFRGVLSHEHIDFTKSHSLILQSDKDYSLVHIYRFKINELVTLP